MMFNLDEKIKSGIGGELITNAVCVGDNVAIIAKSETNEQFWLLLVDRTIHIVHESFEDEWDNFHVEGDVVLRGYWYERLHVGSRSYTFHDDKPLAYIFSHLVITSKLHCHPLSILSRVAM